jgi:23S rRNA (guanosine2251-2'-O)-methyltransferase
MRDCSILEGHASVEAALRGGNREIHAVYIRKGKFPREAACTERLAREAGVPVERKAAEFIDSHTQGKTHGGVIALVGERKYQTLAELMPTTGTPLVAMLDGIEDPFNLGYALRALYAAGVNGVVVRPRDWTSVAGIVARASAGASELISLAEARSPLEAARFFREQGLAVACTAKRDAVSIYDANLTGPLFLVIGGEKRGMSRAILDQADIRLWVPYGRTFAASLPTAAAAAVIAFEVMRQRR